MCRISRGQSWQRGLTNSGQECARGACPGTVRQCRFKTIFRSLDQGRVWGFLNCLNAWLLIPVTACTSEMALCFPRLGQEAGDGAQRQRGPHQPWEKWMGWADLPQSLGKGVLWGDCSVLVGGYDPGGDNTVRRENPKPHSFLETPLGRPTRTRWW